MILVLNSTLYLILSLILFYFILYSRYISFFITLDYIAINLKQRYGHL